MSYTYSRERDWDESRPISIKRYVIPAEDDRRDFMSRHDDYAGERELVIRRKADRSEPMTISRYEREVDYEPPARRFDRDFYERESLHPSDDALLHSHHSLRPPPMGPRSEWSPMLSIPFENVCSFVKPGIHTLPANPNTTLCAAPKPTRIHTTTTDIVESASTMTDVLGAS